MAGHEQLLTINPRPSSYLSLLDANTLAKVFQHLDLYELLQVGEIDMIYQRIIGEHIIAKGTLNVSKVSAHYYTRHTLKQLGEFATALIIKESDIQHKDERYSFIGEIFRLIQKRCTIDRLKSIEITLDKNKKESRIINMIPDAFNHITSLSIDMRLKIDYDGLLEIMMSHCASLKSLTLRGAHANWDFLRLPQLHSLETLRFVKCRIQLMQWFNFISVTMNGVRPLKSLEMTDLTIQLNEMNLVEYYHNGSIDGGKVNRNLFLRRVAEAFPHLERLIFYEKLTVWKSCFDNSRCTPVTRLHHLKELKIYGNCKQIIPALARTNSVEKLTIEIGVVFNIKWNSGIHMLTNLRTIEFIHSPYINPSSERWGKFHEFFQLPNLEECILTRESYAVEKSLINFVVVLSDNLKVLRINAPTGRIGSQFYNFLVRERLMVLSNAQPLHLYARFNHLKRYRPDVIVAHNYDINIQK